MFKIQPIQDMERQLKAAAAVHTTAVPGAFAYEMVDCEDGHLMGFSQFEILDGRALLYDLREVPELKDFEAMFILGRATLNFIDLCGVHLCRSTARAGEERLLHAIGFCPDGEGLLCDMTDMFSGHCSDRTNKDSKNS